MSSLSVINGTMKPFEGTYIDKDNLTLTAGPVPPAQQAAQKRGINLSPNRLIALIVSKVIFGLLIAVGAGALGVAAPHLALLATLAIVAGLLVVGSGLAFVAARKPNRARSELQAFLSIAVIATAILGGVSGLGYVAVIGTLMGIVASSFCSAISDALLKNRDLGEVDHA